MLKDASPIYGCWGIPWYNTDPTVIRMYGEENSNARYEQVTVSLRDGMLNAVPVGSGSLESYTSMATDLGIRFIIQGWGNSTTPSTSIYVGPISGSLLGINMASVNTAVDVSPYTSGWYASPIAYKLLTNPSRLAIWFYYYPSGGSSSNPMRACKVAYVEIDINTASATYCSVIDSSIVVSTLFNSQVGGGIRAPRSGVDYKFQ